MQAAVAVGEFEARREITFSGQDLAQRGLQALRIAGFFRQVGGEQCADLVRRLQRQFARRQRRGDGEQQGGQYERQAMASAFGNGVITRQFTPADRWQSYLARPLSFYNNPSIDRAAKRVLRLIDEWIPKGRTMDDPEFARIYVSALKDAFGPDLTRPALYLSAAFIHVDGKFGRDYLRTLRNALGVASAYSQVTNEITEDTLKDYRSQPNLSAVFTVPPARLDALVAQGVLLSADAERIRTEVASKGSAIFSRPRSAVAYSFVIVTDDLVEAEKRGRQLAGAAEIFEGILG